MMAKVLQGLEDAMRALNERLAQIKDLAAEGVRDTGLAVLSQAVRDAPVATGELRRSGHMEWAGGGEIASGQADGSVSVRDSGVPEGQDDPAVIISFTAPHAVKQHEGVEYGHPKGGKAKYLQDAALSIAQQLPAAVAAKVGEALR